MKRFKVGDPVMISPSSMYWGEGDSNPSDTKGEVTRDDLNVDNHIYQVKWINGVYNEYREEDLVPYDEIGVLLDEARRRFKPGCRYLNTDGVKYRSSEIDFLYVYSKRPIRIALASGQGLIYDGANGKWGEVIEEPMSYKFKVGDRVIASEEYGATKEGWVGYVVEVKDGGEWMRVSLDKGGTVITYGVQSKYFNLHPEEQEPRTDPFKHPYDNCVIEVLDPDHGREVIKWWQNQGVHTGTLKGGSTKKGESTFRFYGLRNKVFSNYKADICVNSGLKIITLPEQNKAEQTKGNIHSQIKTKQNGNTKQQAESGKTIKVQRVDLQIRKGSIGRRAGLKGSGVEVSIGNRHRNHKTRSILG